MANKYIEELLDKSMPFKQAAKGHVKAMGGAAALAPALATDLIINTPKRMAVEAGKMFGMQAPESIQPNWDTTKAARELVGGGVYDVVSGVGSALKNTAEGVRGVFSGAGFKPITPPVPAIPVATPAGTTTAPAKPATEPIPPPGGNRQAQGNAGAQTSEGEVVGRYSGSVGFPEQIAAPQIGGGVTPQLPPAPSGEGYGDYLKRRIGELEKEAANTPGTAANYNPADVAFEDIQKKMAIARALPEGKAAGSPEQHQAMLDRKYALMSLGKELEQIAPMTSKGQYGIAGMQAETTRRGQDITAETAGRAQDITARGQDISAITGMRGQDITAQSQAAQNALRSSDLANEALYRAGLLSQGQMEKELKGKEFDLKLAEAHAPVTTETSFAGDTETKRVTKDIAAGMRRAKGGDVAGLDMKAIQEELERRRGKK